MCCVSVGLAVPLRVMVSAWCARGGALLGAASQPRWTPALPFSPSRGGPPSGPARAAGGPGPSRGGDGPASLPPSRDRVFLRAEEAVFGGTELSIPCGNECLLTFRILRGEDARPLLALSWGITCLGHLSLPLYVSVPVWLWPATLCGL